VVYKIFYIFDKTKTKQMTNLSAEERVRLDYLEQALIEHNKLSKFIIDEALYFKANVNLAKVKVALEVEIEVLKTK